VIRKTIVNAIGVQTEIELDALGRIYAICKRDPMGVAISGETILYDTLGNQACHTTELLAEGSLPKSQIMRCSYGPMGRIEEKIEGYGTQEEKCMRYSYNAIGQLASKQACGAPWPLMYTYNGQGRLLKVESGDKSDEGLLANSYSYDRVGNITSARALGGKSVARKYNAFNELTEETVSDA